MYLCWFPGYNFGKLYLKWAVFLERKISINYLKTENTLNYLPWFGSYRTLNKIRLGYENQQVNRV